MSEKRCKFCGSDGGEFGLWQIRGYDWEAAMRGDENALSISITLGHQCADGTSCAQRIVEQGSNVEALHKVAKNPENLGELATKAQVILNDYAALANEIARTNDAAAREDGYGQIGGGLPQ